MTPAKTTSGFYMWFYIDSLVQERRSSSASAMDLRLSCNYSSIFNDIFIRKAMDKYWFSSDDEFHLNLLIQRV